MKISEIVPGRVYRNRGAGRTTRRVIAVGLEHRPRWYGDEANPPPADEPGVLFEQGGKQKALFITSFAQWAGELVAKDAE